MTPVTAPTETDRLIPDAQPWVQRTVARFRAHYVGDAGLIVTAIDGASGAIIDDEPLVADFGDVLPFLARYESLPFALDQVARADAVLRRGLYRQADGGVRLFSNHDWLLGLIELHELTGAPALLEAAIDGANAVLAGFDRCGLLIDEAPAWRRPRTLLQRSSAFNLGYVELLVDLYALTGERRFLTAAQRIGTAYAATRHFRAHGVFGTVFCSWSGAIDKLAARAATMRSLLFKDNTNGVWGLLALYQASPSKELKATLERWIAGFETCFWNGGDVQLWRDRQGARDVSLKAAFSSLDLLCDLHLAGFGHALELGRAIGERWLGYQWANGLFPVVPGRPGDHLDCNTDMTVSLMKLAGCTGEARFAEAARRCANATVTLHETGLGMIQSVDEQGVPRDTRIIVKYQSLALKLALLPADPAALLADAALLKLLRDR